MTPSPLSHAALAAAGTEYAASAREPGRAVDLDTPFGSTIYLT